MDIAGTHHVAQFNWGILIDDWDTPAVAEFQNNLARVSAVATRSKGFIWQMSQEKMETEQLDPGARSRPPQPLQKRSPDSTGTPQLVQNAEWVISLESDVREAGSLSVATT